jgi:hypothetical protein
MRFAMVALLLAVPYAAAGQTNSDMFLALDLSGGYAGDVSSGESDADVPRLQGWEIGATLRVPTPWFGVAGHVSRATLEDQRILDYVVGPRFSTRHDGYYSVRYFGHVLVGASQLRLGPASEHGAILLVGGGLDALVLRFQLDYVKRNFHRLPKNDARVFFGGAFPLCFRGCRPDDRDGLTLPRP